MPPERCTLEIHVAGAWRVAGKVTVQEPERGISSPASFEYDFDYLDAMAAALHARDDRLAAKTLSSFSRHKPPSNPVRPTRLFVDATNFDR